MERKEQTLPRWKAVVLRLFGLLHLAYAVWGSYLVALTLLIVSSRGGWSYLQADPVPYYAEVYGVRVAISIVFLAALVAAGLLLLHLKDNAVRLSNWLFASLVVYYLVGLFGSWGRFQNAVGASGIGNMGILPMIFTGYPLICLVVLNLLGRRPKAFLDAQRAAGPPSRI